MKYLILGGSLLANVLLAAAFIVRPSLAPPPMAAFIRAHAILSAPAVEKTSPPETPKKRVPMWSRLETDDLKQLAHRLSDAGFPPNIIRSVILSLINARFSAKFHALTAPDPNTPFWKQHPFLGVGDKRLAEYQQLQQERSRLTRELLSDPALAQGETGANDRRRYGNLPPAKIDMVRRIEEDYSDMTSAVRAGMNGIELPTDHAQLALLAKEKRADLQSVLTPDEFAEYEMRTSPITTMLGNRLGSFDPTEPEFQAMFQAYQSLGDKYGTSDNPFMRMDLATRDAAQQMLATQLQSALGADRYNQLIRDTTSDYRTFQQIAEKQSMPATAADQAYALRDATAQQSMQIVNDSNLSPADKRAQLKLLADNARIQLSTLLPGDATQAYEKRAAWLRYLDQGMGLVLTPTPPLVIATDTGGTSSFVSSQERPVPVRGGHR